MEWEAPSCRHILTPPPREKHHKTSRNCQKQLCQNSGKHWMKKEQLHSRKALWCFTCLFAPPAPWLRDSTEEPQCRTLVLRSRADLPHKLLCVTVLTWLGAAWRNDTGYSSLFPLNSELRLEMWWALLGNASSWTKLADVWGKRVWMKHTTDHLSPKNKSWGSFSGKLGHSKVQCIWSNLESHTHAQDKVRALKRPEKSIRSHLELMPRFSVSLVKGWRSTLAQAHLQRLGEVCLVCLFLSS